MNDLEKSGLDTLEKMGLKCFGDLGHLRIADVFPYAAVPQGEHFEFDYFVLCGDKCLVGEMSGLSDAKDIHKKYKNFQRNFGFLLAARDTSFFDHFNIPSKDKHLFRQVKSLQAFFIVSNCEQFDVNLQTIPNIAIIYRGDWNTIKSYAEAFGKFAQYPFLKLINVTEPHDIGKDLRFEVGNNKLIHIPSRVIAKDVNIKADVFTFVARPTDLLNIAEVFRRELMPVVTADNRYQRPLDFRKLRSMKKLVLDRNFTFPNSILISLDAKCSYNKHTGELRIPVTA